MVDFLKYVNTLLCACVLSQLCANTAQAGLQMGGREVSIEQVAVMVFARTPDAEKFKRAAQSRLETILLDNGVTVLDQDKVEELKNVWKRLEDPGYFVTAEDFVANAERYNIDGLIRLYLRADVTRGLGNFYTATAHADFRLVDSEANVESYTTVPMGVPGMPPSDGLTSNAAIVNAIQRAVDEASSKTGLEIIDYARPRSLSYKLRGPLKAEFQPDKRRPEPKHEFADYATLANKTWTREEVSVTCKAPSGELGAVGGYIRETSQGMRRSYASKIHLVDLADKKESGSFDSTTAKKKSRSGSVRLLDCMFIGSWRYLAAVTGLELFLWDTETGKLMSSAVLDAGTDKALLAYTRYNDTDYLSVDTGNEILNYEIVRQ